MNPQREGIHWLRYPEAEVFVNDHLSQFVGRVAPVQALQADLMAHTGTRLVDWLNHLVLADGDAVRGQLADLGFEPEDVPAQPGDAVYGHPGAIVPRLVLRFGVDFPPLSCFESCAERCLHKTVAGSILP